MGAEVYESYDVVWGSVHLCRNWGHNVDCIHTPQYATIAVLRSWAELKFVSALSGSSSLHLLVFRACVKNKLVLLTRVSFCWFTCHSAYSDCQYHTGIFCLPLYWNLCYKVTSNIPVLSHGKRLALGWCLLIVSRLVNMLTVWMVGLGVSYYLESAGFKGISPEKVRAAYKSRTWASQSKLATQIVELDHTDVRPWPNDL